MITICALEFKVQAGNVYSDICDRGELVTLMDDSKNKALILEGLDAKNKLSGKSAELKKVEEDLKKAQDAKETDKAPNL